MLTQMYESISMDNKRKLSYETLREIVSDYNNKYNDNVIFLNHNEDQNSYTLSLPIKPFKLINSIYSRISYRGGFSILDGKFIIPNNYH